MEQNPSKWQQEAEETLRLMGAAGSTEPSADFTDRVMGRLAEVRRSRTPWWAAAAAVLLIAANALVFSNLGSGNSAQNPPLASSLDKVMDAYQLTAEHSLF